MFNIYSFLYFTLSLSILAAFLLLLKHILLDKLPPRWQYGVWWILALRAVLPMSAQGRELTAPLRLPIEFFKQLVEPSQPSAYTDLVSVTTVRFPIPVLTDMPVSITDFLFVLYALGVLLSLTWYVLSYHRLRKLLKKSCPGSAETLQAVEYICKVYNLSSCEIREVNGLSSPLVCGVFHPILAVPAGTVPSHMVLLHELLHLRHRDAIQNVFWCVFRALNWCNPFLHYVCNRIGNDMESLCDQRVLERLEGEERREYGLTLLSMANEKYARAPGTTSLSNGGAFIAKRIEAIARFKRYPQGMSLVSICLSAVLCITFFFGNTASAALYDSPKYLYGGKADQALALASARLYHCTTVAGALDTYAKGMLTENRLWVAAAARLENQNAIMTAQTEPWLPYNHQMLFNAGNAYEIYNISRGEDGIFTGQIIYKIDSIPGDPDIIDNALVEWYAVYPFRAGNSQGRFWAEADGLPYRQMVTGNDLFQLPFTLEYYGEGETGSAAVYTRLTASISGTDTEGPWFSTQVSTPPEPNAVFSRVMYDYRYEYRCTEDPVGMTRATMLVKPIASEEDAPVFEDPAYNSRTVGSGYVTASSNNGTASISREVPPDWNGILTGGGGHGYSGQDIETEDFMDYFPYAYAVRIILSGEVREDLLLKVVSR